MVDTMHRIQIVIYEYYQNNMNTMYGDNLENVNKMYGYMMGQPLFPQAQ